MRIQRHFLLYVLFITLIFALIFPTTAFAASGQRTDPFSGYIKRSLTCQEYSFIPSKQVEVQLTQMIRGEEANSIVAEENMFNDTPAGDEEWMLFKYHIKYVSGPDEPLYATDVIYTGTSFYTANYTAISPISTTAFSGERSGLGQFDVNMYPGGESDVWYGLLVKKTVGHPLYRIATGYDDTTFSPIYTWFSTDPNYIESSDPVPPPVQTVTVSFNSQGGSAVASATITSGSLITSPVAPTRTGYTFVGWFKDASCTAPWSFSADTVTSDTILYAGWVAQVAPSNYLRSITLSAGKLSRSFSAKITSYTVTLGENDGSVTIQPVKAYNGASMTIDGKKTSSKTVKLSNGKSATVTVKVTWKNKTTIYKLTIKRPKSTNNLLKAMKVSAGTLSPAFDPNTTSYTLTLPSNISKTTITATKASSLASVAPAKKIFTLKNGQKVRTTVKVKSQSGKTKTYTITIVRTK